MGYTSDSSLLNTTERIPVLFHQTLTKALKPMDHGINNLQTKKTGKESNTAMKMEIGEDEEYLVWVKALLSLSAA